MPTPDVADQASCSQPVTAAGIFEDIAAAFSLNEAKGSPVSGPLASLTDKIIDKTMEDKKRYDLADKYPVPENVTKLNPPKVNPEICRIIEAKTRSKDVKLQKIPQFTLRAMMPIMQVIDSLVAGRDCQESLNFDELVTKLVDAVALTAVGNADANACRRESIKRDLNEEYQAICSNTNPVTQMLFGDNITDQLKSITDSNKIGFKVRAGKFRQTPYAEDRTYRKSGSFLGQRPYPPRYPQKQRGRGYPRGGPHRGQSKGLTYNVLNTARSAISSFICLQNSEFSVGNHPIISRFMRGAFNMRLALPRYVNTWDVSVVSPKQQSPTEKLSFKPLTMKLVMLMALLSGQRAQSLQMLDIKNMGHAGDTVTDFIRYTYDVDLCVVKTLDVYIEQSSGKRGEVSDLFISVQTPHKGVSTETISRWLKSVLTSAGIDTKQFKKGHSVRSAATSAAFGTGTSIQTIMNAAGWSSECTFNKFYNKQSLTDHSFAE
ncbi:LOW QUALITY PROTEIN: hypothetical protein MAR_004623, partial [Mya arenaria]